jgi:hypothetical protein
LKKKFLFLQSRPWGEGRKAKTFAPLFSESKKSKSFLPAAVFIIEVAEFIEGALNMNSPVIEGG